jgi:hypothetical protein
VVGPQVGYESADKSPFLNIEEGSKDWNCFCFRNIGLRHRPCNEAACSNFRKFTMIPCSEDSIGSELHNLREVRANLIECLDVLPEDDVARIKMDMALSFVQLARGCPGFS